MQLAINYVAKLAGSLHNPEVTYTVLASGKEAQVMAEASNVPDLLEQIKQVNLSPHPDRNDSEGLYEGASKAVEILKQTSGVRSVVILSDDDDDIKSKEIQKLKTEFAEHHIRCYSILLANRDFYGTKARSAAGIHLRSLSTFTGGGQYQTNWQERRADLSVLSAITARMTEGSIISFTLPEHLGAKPGTYSLKAQLGQTGKSYKTTPFVVSP